MPDHSPSTDERASLAQLSQSSLPLECTSHLGFGLGSVGHHPCFRKAPPWICLPQGCLEVWPETRFSPSRRFLNVDYRCNSGFLKRIAYTTMPYKTGLPLLGVARNPANGFPARLLGGPVRCSTHSLESPQPDRARHPHESVQSPERPPPSHRPGSTPADCRRDCLHHRRARRPSPETLTRTARESW